MNHRMSKKLSKRREIWTPANIVTLARICLVPLFVVALISPWPQWFGLPQVADDTKSFWAAGLFIIISSTDWLDGYLARKRGEVTDFGKFMDPLADKILVAAALLALIELGSLPSWVALVILAREFIVSGVRMVAASENVVIAASWYGKFKTVFQMIAIVLFTVKDNHMMDSASTAFSDGLWLVSWTVMIIALVLTIVSMLDYIAKARHLIGFGKNAPEKASAPSSPCVPNLTDSTTKVLAAQVIQQAQEARLSISTAESLTGGLIAATLTLIPGSSKVVYGGVASYTNEVKHSVLGVKSFDLNTFGAVSQQTACAMAQGVRTLLKTDFAVSVTGIAGPGGAEPGKPVGTVWIGLAGPKITRASCYLFSGNRDQVRAKTVHKALEIILADITSHA